MVKYDGLTEAELIHALYKGSKALGMGTLHDKPDLTLADVEQDLANMPHGLSFDYYRGHPFKFSIDKAGKQFDERLFDRDAGVGSAQRIVQAALATKNQAL